MDDGGDNNLSQIKSEPSTPLISKKVDISS